MRVLPFLYGTITTLSYTEQLTIKRRTRYACGEQVPNTHRHVVRITPRPPTTASCAWRFRASTGAGSASTARQTSALCGGSLLVKYARNRPSSVWYLYSEAMSTKAETEAASNPRRARVPYRAPPPAPPSFCLELGGR